MNKGDYDALVSSPAPSYPELHAPPGYEESVLPERPEPPAGQDQRVHPSAPNSMELASSGFKEDRSDLQPQPARDIFVSFQLGRGQSIVTCPRCKANVLTETTTKSKCLAHCSCFLLTIFGCVLCCCIPYCMDSCKVVTHKCPQCKTVLGSVS